MIRVSEEQINRIADKVSHRYMTGQQEEHSITDNLILRETSLFAFGVDQGAKKIVTRVGASFHKQVPRIVPHLKSTSRHSLSRFNGDGDDIEKVNEVHRPLHNLAAVFLANTHEI